ncbi:hypothetical protein BZA77DRAFT_321943 [Pyronema omphalodes]|nr:hypothetical protein BZA77DRAFT_321943 [Pyronema omphalodes]
MVMVDISLTVVAEIMVVGMIWVLIIVTWMVRVWMAGGRIVCGAVVVVGWLDVSVRVGAVRSLVRGMEGMSEDAIGRSGIGRIIDETIGVIMLVGTGTILSRTEEMIGIIELVGNGSKMFSDVVGGSNGINVRVIGVLIGIGRIPKSGSVPAGSKEESIGPAAAVGVK